MSNTLVIDKKTMFDIKSAAQTAGYSRDYVARLAREGKVVATQVGRQWYLDIDSLKQYATVSELEQKIKQEHLSEQRRHERELTERIQSHAEAKVRNSEENAESAKRAVATLVLAGLLSVLGASSFMPGFSSSNPAGTPDAQLASVQSYDENKVSGDTALFGDIASTDVFSDGSFDTRTLAESDMGILLLPQELSGTSTLPAVELFSDDVLVRTDKDGRMFIAPADADGNQIGPETSFVLVPSKEIVTP